MEDITTYGEISGASHKGETTTATIVLGLCLALAGVFFVVDGLYHVFCSLTPYWQRVAVGALAEQKGTTNFLAFAALALGRPLFGCFLGFLALEVWDGKNVARKWLFLIVLPVVLWYGSALLGLPAAFADKLWSFDYLMRNLGAISFVASLGLVLVTITASAFLGWAFRDSASEATWPMAVLYVVILAVVVFGMVSQLEPIELDTALLANLPPFSDADSGLRFLVLETITPEYLDCMTTIKLLERACVQRSRVQAIAYENFDNKLRSKKLLEILYEHRCLADIPECPDGGAYVVQTDGTWTCSVHGAYDDDRVQRGKANQAAAGLGADDATTERGM